MGIGEQALTHTCPNSVAQRVKQLCQAHSHCPLWFHGFFYSKNVLVGALVLKYTWGLFPSDTLRHTDMEMTLRKEEVYSHRSLNIEGSAQHMLPPPPPGKRQSQAGRRGTEREDVGKSLYSGRTGRG